jgi:ceramide glucosyltransferase
LLGSLFVNDWFMPSVYVAALFGSRAFAFGATIALRREALETIGGFQALADQLADDYRIGELTRQKGLRTVLSEVTVETFMDEPSLRELVLHELRWLRTIRAVRPAGYAAAFPTFYLPVTALGAALAGGSPAALTLLAVTVIARLMLHSAVCRPRLALTQLWALPLSDGLALALWCWGFATREVHWRQARYVIARDGSVHPIS